MKDNYSSENMQQMVHILLIAEQNNKRYETIQAWEHQVMLKIQI
jgi:hypothetical protein